jgi:hypothetical protein
MVGLAASARSATISAAVLPVTAPGGLCTVHPVSHGNDGIQIVELNLPANLPDAFCLNSPSFSESSRAIKLSRIVNAFQMVTYGPQVHSEERCNLSLIEPKGLGLVKHLDSDLAFRSLI